MGRIAAIGKVRESADLEIDAKGDVVMPGLINTHSHVAMATMKAMADDVTFPNFLDRVFALDSKRTDKDIKIGAELGCLEMIRSGTTSFVDLYYSEDVIGKVVEQGRPQGNAVLGSAGRRVHHAERGASGQLQAVLRAVQGQQSG